MKLGALSLKWKVLLGITVTCIVAVVASNMIVLRMEVQRLDSVITEDAQTLARIVGGSMTGVLEFGDKISARDTLSTLSKSHRVVAAVIYDNSGSPFVWYEKGGNASDALPADLPSKSLGLNVSSDGNFLEVSEPIGDGSSSIFMRVGLDQLNEAIASAVTTTVVIILVVSVVAAVISFLVQAAIVNPINKVVAALKDIAEGEGDLTQRLAEGSKDEVGQLSKWFNIFIARVHNIIGDFSTTATELNSNADKLSYTAKETERGVVNQQSQIQQVVTAVREMASVVEEVAQNVTQAADSAEEADRQAKNGKSVVSGAMGQIESLSRDINAASEVIDRLQQETDNIGSVLDVIRGIAEQTNLLALNAAIEAARAGEQGRGFAVVADEVRTLASRTQTSTQEIQEMIERLQAGAREAVQMMEKGTAQAQESVSQADQASDSLEAITTGVSAIRDKTNQIASASEEQSAATREIERNMESIAGVARQTAEGSVEIASSIADLANAASTMTATVGQFKL